MIEMKVLVSGDRYYTDWDCIRHCLHSLSKPNELPWSSKRKPHEIVIIQAECCGADSLAKSIASELGYQGRGYPTKRSLGRKARPLRNREMLSREQPQLILIFHDNLDESKETKNFIAQARQICPRTTIYHIHGHNWTKLQ